MRYIFLLLMLFVLCGCNEFAGGFGAGAAAMKRLSDDAQADFVESVELLNAATAENEAAAGAAGEYVGGLVKPETIRAIASLKGREKDPATWIALFSLLANGVWAGRAIEKRVAK